ncbi:hypothetical protein Skr01_29040 [Sphaerisporangium krabiense]|uniref:Secreted protein n=1 Tax=Sphaerisporangium krabiense TaxID=763782 RepID=A0A7W8ZAB9_9ACTN|nr:hypothetical protein [Sphaerisporangium krabiense]MBB5630230.1 hypothetical protein [Sphaerisporangium krabiense]GII62819.1 hypothetical protein Skr01_29040 [Sphaerisporangium krabiense]
MSRALAALLAGTLLAALTLLTTSPANADMLNMRWFVTYKQSVGTERYWAGYGGYNVTGLDPNRIQPTGKLALSGGVIDVGNPLDERCTWVLFRITYYDYEQATPKQTEKGYRSCVPGQRVPFTFEHEDVSKLEAKPCWKGMYEIPDRTCADPYQLIFKTYP